MPPNPNYAPFVYSEELSKLGYGRPMYIPEPTTSGQIEIGDVGIIEERVCPPLVISP